MCTLGFLRSSTLELRNQASSLFPTSFSRKLVSEIRHFSHPRWLPYCRCYCSSLFFTFRVPPASYIRRLHRGAPFPETCSWQKVDREDRATGKSRALFIPVPSSIHSFSCALRPSYRDSFPCLIFPLLYRYYEKCCRRTERITKDEK